MKMKDQQRGFTLIELLVVVAIIGLLASIVIASLNSARIKGRDARRVADVKTLQNALEMYNDANSSYPSSTQPTVSATALASYLSALPKDPSTQAAYAYIALQGASGGTTSCGGYHIGAVLENSSNTALNSSANATQSTVCSGLNNGVYGDASTTNASLDFLGGTAKCTATTGGTRYCYDQKM